MKKILFFLFVGLVSVTPAFAQDFEFEMTRTAEVPGFFMVRIFPGLNNAPLPIQNIFVVNYKKKNADIYKDLLPFLREFGGKIIPGDEVDKYAQNKNNRLIFLGEEREGFAHFQSENKENILDEFEAFAEENLNPTVLENVTAKFGGNIHEVFPAIIPSVGFDDVFFVGKFEKAMKTRMEIQGISAEGEIKAVAPLFLNDDTFTESPLAKEIPGIWEEMWKQANTEETSFDWFKSLNVNDLFPLILLVAGVIILFVTVKKFAKRNKQKSEELSIDDNGIPSHQNWKDMPFEVEKREEGM